MKTRTVLSQPDFYKVCRWLEDPANREGVHHYSTLRANAAKALGFNEVPYTTMKDAVKATGCDIERPAKPPPGPIDTTAIERAYVLQLYSLCRKLAVPLNDDFKAIVQNMGAHQ